MFKNKSNIKPSLGSTINTNHPLAQGLVGCWLFNEQTGNKIYDLNKDNHGNLINGVVRNPNNFGSLQFDGTNDYAEFGVLQLTRYTLSIWFNATGVPSHNDGYGGFLYSNNPQYFGAVSLCLGYRWDNNTFLVFQNSGFNITSSYVPANKITNAVVTYDGSFVKVYIDGKINYTLPYTTDPTYPSSGNLNMKLGAWGYSGYERHFNGHIYQFSMYNRALSAEEVLSLYEQPYQFIDPSAALKYYSYSQHRSLAAPSIKSEEKIHFLNKLDNNISFSTVSGFNREYLNIEFNSSTQVTNYQKLSSPSNPSITTIGTSGSTQYSYKITAINEYGETTASSVTISNGNSTLNSSNFNRIKWDVVNSCLGYRIYGRTLNSEQLLATVLDSYYDDQGSAIPNGSLPTTNTTGYDYKKLSLGWDYKLYTGTLSENNYIQTKGYDLYRFRSENITINNNYLHFFDVAEYSDYLNYIVSWQPNFNTTYNTFALIKHDKINGTFKYSGSIYCASGSVSDIKVLIYRYTTGTVSGSGTTITGIGTNWKSSNFAVGSRIGFGTNDPTFVTKWYVISNFNSDTTLTISEALSSNVNANTLFVIEEIRLLILYSNNLTIIKGITEKSFMDAKIFNVEISVDNLERHYVLRDDLLVSTTKIGLAVAPSIDFSTQYCYVIAFLSSTILWIHKHNIRSLNTISLTGAGLYERRYSFWHADNLAQFDRNFPTSYPGFITSIAYPGASYGSAYSWMFTGYFTPPTTGTYTFYTLSDDGSFVWVGPEALTGFTTANAVVKNGGVHGAQEVSGTISLNAGQTYPVRIIFGDQGSFGLLTFSWAGPGIAKNTDLSQYFTVNETGFASNLIYRSGGTFNNYGTDKQGMNGQYLIPKHGPYKNIPCIGYYTSAYLHLIKESNITENNINIIDHSNTIGFLRPNQSSSYTEYGRVGAYAHDNLLDRSIFGGSAYHSLKISIAKISQNDSLADTSLYMINNINDSYLKPANLPSAMTVPDGYIRSLNGWLYKINGSDLWNNLLHAIPVKNHWIYTDRFKNYCLSPIVYLDKNVILRKIHLSENNMFGDGFLGVSPEPIKLYVRNYGIEDDTGLWTLIDSTGSLAQIQNTGKLQVRFDSSVTLHQGLPKRIYGFSLEFDKASNIPIEFEWDLENTNYSLGIVGFTQTILCRSNPSFAIKFTNKLTRKVYYIQNTDKNQFGQFEYYSGGWVIGFGPNQIGTKRRFISTNILQKNIEYEIDLEVRQ
jgi:hypothetical protein